MWALVECCNHHRKDQVHEVYVTILLVFRINSNIWSTTPGFVIVTVTFVSSTSLTIPVFVFRQPLLVEGKKFSDWKGSISQPVARGFLGKHNQFALFGRP
jgi:hypothetical protein